MELRILRGLDDGVHGHARSGVKGCTGWCGIGSALFLHDAPEHPSPSRFFHPYRKCKKISGLRKLYQAFEHRPGLLCTLVFFSLPALPLTISASSAFTSALEQPGDAAV